MQILQNLKSATVELPAQGSGDSCTWGCNCKTKAKGVTDNSEILQRGCGRSCARASWAEQFKNNSEILLVLYCLHFREDSSLQVCTRQQVVGQPCQNASQLSEDVEKNTLIPPCEHIDIVLDNLFVHLVAALVWCMPVLPSRSSPFGCEKIGPLQNRECPHMAQAKQRAKTLNAPKMPIIFFQRRALYGCDCSDQLQGVPGPPGPKCRKSAEKVAKKSRKSARERLFRDFFGTFSAFWARRAWHSL